MMYPEAEYQERYAAQPIHSEQIQFSRCGTLTSRVLRLSSNRQGTSAPSSSRLTPVTCLLRSFCSGQSKTVRPVRLRIRNGASVPRPSFTFSASLLQTVAVVMASSMRAEVTLSSSLSAAVSRTLMGLWPGPADVRFT